MTWTVEERDRFRRRAEADGCNWSHTTNLAEYRAGGRAQAVSVYRVYSGGPSVHVTFEEGSRRVYATRLGGPDGRDREVWWLDGGPDEWARVLEVPR